MKRVISIKIPPTGKEKSDLKGVELNSAPIEDDDGNPIGGIIYRAEERGRSILIQEVQIDNDGGEEVVRAWAYHNRPAEIEFDPADDEEDDEGEGFELFAPLAFGEGEDLYE